MAYRAESLGRITEIGETISWATFPSATLDLASPDNDAVEDEISVPVSTAELVDAGIDLEEDDRYFWAEIDLEAADRGDVLPSKFGALPKVDLEFIVEFERGEN